MRLMRSMGDLQGLGASLRGRERTRLGKAPRIGDRQSPVNRGPNGFDLTASGLQAEVPPGIAATREDYGLARPAAAVASASARKARTLASSCSITAKWRRRTRR